jgi:DNA-binding NarL/FixJ family response regulator
VIGEAADGAAAVRAAARQGPAIVHLDIGHPDVPGLDLVGPIPRAAPGAIVILISSRRAGDYGPRLEGSGADGFIDKARLSTDRLTEILSGQIR